MASAARSDTDHTRYAKCVEVSKRVRWDMERDVIRGREFDFSQKFLPDGLSLIDRLGFLSTDEARRLSQVQGRTYANLFVLVERFISAKVLDVSRHHWFGDQTALEALIRFSDEELKHQQLFRRIDDMIARGMPDGYRFVPDANAVAAAVLERSTWAVLALTCHVELFTQAHYKQSIEPDAELSELFRDVFLFHWREESQHTVLDELEWRYADADLGEAQRDRAVDELIGLFGVLDGALQSQSQADSAYFCTIAGRPFDAEQREAIRAGLLAAYRWQFILSGAQEPRYNAIICDLISEPQADRIVAALDPIA